MPHTAKPKFPLEVGPEGARGRRADQRCRRRYEARDGGDHAEDGRREAREQALVRVVDGAARGIVQRNGRFLRGRRRGSQLRRRRRFFASAIPHCWLVSSLRAWCATLWPGVNIETDKWMLPARKAKPSSGPHTQLRRRRGRVRADGVPAGLPQRLRRDGLRRLRRGDLRVHERLDVLRPRRRGLLE